MKLSKGQILKRMERQHSRCYYCGQWLTDIKFHIDHFLPFSKYRNGKSTNLVLACVPCNKMKREFDIEEFRIAAKAKNPNILIGNKFYFETINLQ